MTVWIIEPRDPLIVRDGHPFSADPGAWASSLPFPFPSTIAGGVRTRAGLDDNGLFRFTSAEKDQLRLLKQLGVRGPLLVQLPTNANDVTLVKWLVPAPSDALIFDAKDAKLEESADLLKHLVPLERTGGAQTDLDGQGLWLVGQHCHDKRKPSKKAPRYWYWDKFQAWLHDPSSLCKNIQQVSELGLGGPTREQRLHVSIDPSSETARDGMLFGTSGLEFNFVEKGDQPLREAKRLALAVAVEDNEQFNLQAGFAGFGGERRIVSWRRSEAKLPMCCPDLKTTIVQEKCCRLLLLTPAHFHEGYRPTWLQEDAAENGVSIDIQAIAIQRPQIVSGWDLALRKPKPSRRLAPAGTVLFLKLAGTDADIQTWIDRVWMHCISDDLQADQRDDISDISQDRKEGFGLAVLGTWDGKQESIQKEQKL